METNQLILKPAKFVISTTTAHAIVSKTGSAAIPIGGAVILVGYILQGKDNKEDNKAFKIISDVCLFTGIITVCLVSLRTINCRATKDNDSYEEKKNWKFAGSGIVLDLASKVVSGTIVYVAGFAVAIPIGGLMMFFGSNYVSGLAGEILYTIGWDTLADGIFSALKYLLIAGKAAKITRINKKMTISAKIISFMQDLYKRMKKK
ncbi:unnamed protein product [Rhizophagus irregularis]|uniref:Uncharacterized protein n=1 Tax=Rhizophagus irregularis TaxID=588596 RepID=A0A2N1MCY8_9GLOM|nr:hypothetical protein RhiirC2_291512 [Rhizophagus irregularis]CAB4385615.1 unnamed protein product [Rhizophagus irregularis]CAB5363731.1 unnamed protein product [Rhizophagus irregularis]